MNMTSMKNISSRMTKGLLLTMLFLTQAVVSSAQVKLYMEDFTIASGETKEVALLLDNDKEATVLQAKFVLPAGLEYVPGSVAKTDRVKGRGAEVQASTSTGSLVIVETDGTIAAGEGAVITFQVRRDNLQDGNHQIYMYDIVVSDADANQLNTEEELFVNVKALGLDDCAFAAADESVEMNVGDEYQFDITLTNEGVYNLSAFEGKLILPEGLEIVPGEEGMFIYSNRIPGKAEFKFQEFEGYTSFVLSSSSNYLIDGTEGVIFSFKVKANAPLESVIKLAELRVAATTGQSALLHDVAISVKVVKPYTIGDVNNDGEITANDASLVLQLVAGKITPDAEGIIYEAADVNGDGEVTANDASLILQLVAGKIAEF